MSELIEKETEEYRKGDPDPFDDRHPGKMYILLCLRLFYFVFLLKKGSCCAVQTGPEFMSS